MKTIVLFMLAVVLSASAQTSTSPQSAPATQHPGTTTPVIPGVNDPGRGPMRGDQRISREVRHELLMLPSYSLFDDLRYSVSNGAVQLLGDVNDGSLRSQAENAVKGIEGVTSVTNNIQVLPPSPMDDRIRRAVARSVFASDGLSRYGWEAAPSIHIIVKNGRVRLVGVVDNDGDRNLAGMAARQVPGVFEVTNELNVMKPR